MSSAGTVNGRGFVISYSVQSGINDMKWIRGSFKVTIDTIVAQDDGCINSTTNSTDNVTKTDQHKFFTNKIALEFGTKSSGGNNVTGSGSMKYILGS